MIQPNKVQFSFKRKEVELGIIVVCLGLMVVQTFTTTGMGIIGFNEQGFGTMSQVFFFMEIIEGTIPAIIFITNIVEIRNLCDIAETSRHAYRGCVISFGVLSTILYIMLLGWQQSWNDRNGILSLIYLGLIALCLGTLYLHIHFLVKLKKYIKVNKAKIAKIK